MGLTPHLHSLDSKPGQNVYQGSENDFTIHTNLSTNGSYVNEENAIGSGFMEIVTISNAETTHIFELYPKDCELFFQHAGGEVLEKNITYY
ncbi:hypothetical protein PN466_06570 [Roseofilum reptotaenium CS-1145]|uniref:Uncharacterized protein n=1 Tax=Roseofilum reptotaenium AO1-A TaxID=1925591 RepID=A0A1L9QPP9_9CYAN|nr:hypothetical protein [Roseofilum reptotaenium]MDB9516612.1 hypothetical protein [Roseofilum reptotaenium CS-1145]OJJ24658.1 hypothetical protein BI308_15275 [Roseofilum reptotaenium AO1-A]